MAKFGIQQFFKRFPDDDACLDHLMKVRYGEVLDCPKCGKRGKFARLSKVLAYSCPSCGHHTHPMEGTIFERSHTPLQKWFYALFLFTTTRHGVSSRELQRQLGVTLKTAWRIGHEIRKYMAEVDGDDLLGGHKIVEADKAYIGGKDKRGEDDKSVVLGIVERNGDVVARMIYSREARFVIPRIMAHVKPGTRIATDEAKAFKPLIEEGFRHGTVNHSVGEYVRGDVHTNSIEGFWAILKRGISGCHIWVSPQHLPKYLGEFEFRFNMRKEPHLMLPLLLSAFPRPAR